MDFFNNHDVKCITYYKQILKTVKPCLTDKTSKDEKITLTGNKKVVSDKRELVKIFNEYFLTIYLFIFIFIHFNLFNGDVLLFYNNIAILYTKKLI